MEERIDDSLQYIFNKLCCNWKKETHLSSSITDIIENESYCKIIELGISVVPLILRELESNANHWDFALRMITGENPITDNLAGNIEEISKAWLDWGRNKGYIR